MIRDDFDVVIVGAGVAGGALATRLARDGLSVLVLERTLVHVDRIRGEWLAPWGVREAERIGILEALIAAGGHYSSKMLRYGDGVPFETARANPLDMAALAPDVPGVLCLGHPRMCDVLDQTAREAGAWLLRGVSSVRVNAGQPPSISFDFEGERHTLRPKLVVGADGRGSLVGRQIGATVRTDPVHHLIAGLLIEDVPDWPQDEQTAGVHNGFYLLVFPQGNGRIRLYLCYALEHRGRFSGPDAARHFLEVFRVPTLPHADAIAAGRVAGPCQGYPNPDTWVDEPAAPGVVLIGDAAGHNDPTIGQGLSITMQDVRMVAEALAATSDWNGSMFAGYVAERRERMRRLRFAARLISKLRCEFDTEAVIRRQAVARTTANDPGAAAPLLTPFIGPFGLPDETFQESAVKRVFGADWSVTADGWFVQAAGAEARSLAG